MYTKAESDLILEDKINLLKVRSTKFAILLISAGAALLALGADVLVGASVEIALRMGASELLAGLTIVAIGTSLPELAATISAVLKKKMLENIGILENMAREESNFTTMRFVSAFRALNRA